MCGRGEERYILSQRLTLLVGEDVTLQFIVYAGPASVACAETLRQEGFKGHIVLASRESVLPYDRPKLSKVCGWNYGRRNANCFAKQIYASDDVIVFLSCQAMHLTPDAIALRSSDFYAAHSIELKMGKEVSTMNNFILQIIYYIYIYIVYNIILSV